MDPALKVRNLFEESIQVLSAADTLVPDIVTAARMTADAILSENKVLTCGNGASAAGAQHFSAIMLNRYLMDRPGLPAIALTSDTITLTSIADDYQFADIFAKQIRALGQPGDILLAMSHSGSSHNVIHAIDAAHDRKMCIVALTGQDGGRIAEMIQEDDIELRAPSWSKACIHQVHLTVIHAICNLIDRHLLGQED